MTETSLQKLSQKSGRVPHRHIIQSLKEKQEARNSTSQNKGLLQDDKTAKNQADFHRVLGFYSKTKYYGDTVTQG
jgi:hypothetical protein